MRNVYSIKYNEQDIISGYSSTFYNKKSLKRTIVRERSMDSFQEIFKKFLQYYFMWTIKFLKDSPVCFDGYFVRK